MSAARTPQSWKNCSSTGPCPSSNGIKASETWELEEAQLMPSSKAMHPNAAVWCPPLRMTTMMMNLLPMKALAQHPSCKTVRLKSFSSSQLLNYSVLRQKLAPACSIDPCYCQGDQQHSSSQPTSGKLGGLVTPAAVQLSSLTIPQHLPCTIQLASCSGHPCCGTCPHRCCTECPHSLGRRKPLQKQPVKIPGATRPSAQPFAFHLLVLLIELHRSEAGKKHLGCLTYV